MSQIKDLIEKIREHEQNAAYAIRTNATELPQIKALLSNISGFGLGDEDKDLEIRLTKLRDQFNELKADDITSAKLASLQNEVQAIIETLTGRYQDRMEQYASRQTYL